MPVKGKVAKILDKHTLVANIGEEDGVEPGMDFLIYQPGETIRDPDSGEVLGKAPDVEKAEVSASEVMENMTVMKTKTETFTVMTDPTNFNLPGLFGKREKIVTERNELNTDEYVPDDRTKISEGDPIRQILSEDEVEAEGDEETVPEDGAN